MEELPDPSAEARDPGRRGRDGDSGDREGAGRDADRDSAVSDLEAARSWDSPSAGGNDGTASWESFMGDLENQFEAARRADLAAEAADLAEAELASIALKDRLPATRGRWLRLRTRSGLVLEGEVLEAHADHLELREEDGLRDLVPVAAVQTATPVPGPLARPTGRTVTLASRLRALVRSRTRIRLILDGEDLAGRVVRVGADHLDLVRDDGPAAGHRDVHGARAAASGAAGGHPVRPPAGGEPVVVTVVLSAVNAVRLT